MNIGAISPGDLTLNANGDGWTFTPTLDFSGTVTISYQVTDGNGGSIQEINTIDIAPINDAPVFGGTKVDENGFITLNPGTKTPIGTNKADLINSDTFTDAEDLDLSDVIILDGSLFAGIGGNFDKDGDQYTYTPPENYSGPVEFTFIVSDKNGGYSFDGKATFTLNKTNDLPAQLLQEPQN